MRKNIRYASIGCICIILSYICYLTKSTMPFVQIIKYNAMAYGVAILMYTILSLRKKKVRKLPILLYIAVCILCIFTLLVIDTYWFHALTWFPGIIRYALFSTYGWMHIVFFILVGLLIYYGSKEKQLHE